MITYDDIKQRFSEGDLLRYNSLCKKFVELTDDKANSELWAMIQQEPSELKDILDEIHTLRETYDFLKGEMFFKVWRLNPNSGEYEEMVW